MRQELFREDDEKSVTGEEGLGWVEVFERGVGCEQDLDEAARSRH